MPEGPEIRRSADAIGQALVGQPITRIEYRVPRLARKARALKGARVTRVYSRGKALLIEFDNGITHYSHNQLYGEWIVSKAAETEGRGEARRTQERAGRRPGAQRASASDGGGRHADESSRADLSEAARRRASVRGRRSDEFTTRVVQGGHVHEGLPDADDRRTVRVIIATPAHSAILYSATQIELLTTSEVERHPYIAALGPDVLDTSTTVAVVRRRLEDKRFRGRSLGSLLLDQRFAAGLGNYLRSDILFVAGLRASVRPQDLDDDARTRLARAILDVSRRSYRNEGVTNDLARARKAKRGGVPFERYRFLAYGRQGDPCWVCGTKIVRRDEGGRGVFHCARCQPAQRRR